VVENNAKNATKLQLKNKDFSIISHIFTDFAGMQVEEKLF